MQISNEPREFTLTSDNLLDTIVEWMPDQLHRMRSFESGSIRLGGGFSALECEYMQTVGGEKFRIVDRTPWGDSGSVYYAPLGEDDNIILAFAARAEKALMAGERRASISKADTSAEMKMTFAKGPFEP